MTEIELNSFITQFKNYLTSNDTESLNSTLNNSKLSKLLTDNCMDFLSVILDNFNESHIKLDEKRIYSKIINFIAENSNPKEIICILNLHLEDVKTDSKFLILLYPISISLQILPKYQHSTRIILRDILTAAVAYFDRLPLAHYSGLEGKELEVYIQASETQRFLRLSNCYLEFLESLNSENNENSRISDEIIRNILTLYDFSLVKLAFSSPGVVAEDCRKCSLRAFSLIERNVHCLHKIILFSHVTNEKITKNSDFSINNAKEKEEKLVSYTSLTCLLYHIFVENNLTKFPQIFSHLYKIVFSLPILTACFRDSSDSNVLRLCLKLLRALLELLEDDDKLPLQLPFFYSLKIALTSNVNREIRGLTFDCFCALFAKLDIEGRYNLLRVMLKDNDHFGLKGQLILLLKREILSALVDNKNEDWKYFRGSLVYPLLCDVFILSDGESTDILNESEWLLAALNLLFVSLKRDKEHCLGLDVIIEDIEHDFIKPLMKGTELCLAHYQNDIRLLVDCDSTSVIEDLSIDCSWMNKTQKIEFLNKAILTLDLVKFNISLVNNLL